MALTRFEGSRRRFLQGAAATAAGICAFELTALPPARAQSTLSPDAALQALLDGNRRYLAQKPRVASEDFASVRHKTEKKQEPFASILACADSRVPVEIIFDQGIGQLFVTRVAGNVASPDVIASLEYAAAELGTPLILVLGHSHCGAVKAAIAGEPVPGQISTLFAPIRAAIDQAGSDIEAAVKANARIQARVLAAASPLLSGLVRDGKLKVLAASYDLESGKVELLA